MADDDETLREFLQRGMVAQKAIDEILTPQQQAAELEADGTYRVHCCQCGKSVSSPLPVAVIVRAWVECPECIALRVEQG